MSAQISAGKVAVKVARALPVAWLRSVNQWMHGSARGRAVLDVIWTRVGEVPVTIPRGPLTGWRFMSGGGQPGYLLGASEPDLQEALVRCIATGDTVYDIGANVGFFTLLAARLASETGRVYAFEPMPINLRVLTRNAQLNSLGHVEVVPSAVSDTCDRVAMSSGNNQATGHIADHDSPDLVTVACTTVDAFVAAGHRPPDVVKIDVEGAEDRVLSGMAHTLKAHRPIILCELHFGPEDPRRTTISHLFTNAGYTETALQLDGGSMAHLLARPHEREASSQA